ncbi:GUMAP protein [Ureaplasma urealyticum]|uniref:GUMAP protein n=1 Tax=Ureaplasma urealyticum TaxID=2130 RepID=UPI0001736082|nr:GUMAP protein [Ureaplasma urealyticum]EDU05991.1 hypothetical protein UUR5_H0002 [Ureaplasma urealyticum serovar 5 str. ATCC 27817]
MAKNSKKKNLIPITTGLVATSVVAIGFGLAKSEQTKSKLDFIIENDQQDNEYAAFKQRQSIAKNNTALLLPFNHEILNAYASLCTNLENANDANIVNLDDTKRANALKIAIQRTLNKNLKNGFSNEHVELAQNKFNENDIAVDFVSSNNNVDKFKIKIKNQDIGEFSVPKFSVKVVDSSSMSELYKALVSSYISSLDTKNSINIPRFDIFHKLLNNLNDKNHDKFVVGSIYYKNLIEELVDTQKNNWNDNDNKAFDYLNAKLWYSKKDKALFVYNNNQKRSFIFKNWDAYLNVSDVLSYQDIYTNDDGFNPQGSPFKPINGNLANIKKAFETKYKANTNFKLGNEGITSYTSISDTKTFTTGTEVQYIRYPSKNPQNVINNPNLKYRYWEISDNNGIQYKLFESQPYIHTTGGYIVDLQTTPNSYDPKAKSFYREVQELYDAFGGKKEMTMDKLISINPNNYFLRRFFLLNVNKWESEQKVPRGHLNNNDSRSLSISYTNDNVNTIDNTINDPKNIIFKLINLGNRQGLIVENAVSSNEVWYDNIAGHQVNMFIDDIPNIIDDSKYRAPTFDDYLKYMFSPNYNVLTENNKPTHSLLDYGSNSSYKNKNVKLHEFDKDRMHRQNGWVINQILMAEHGHDGFVNFLNRRIPYALLQPWFFSKYDDLTAEDSQKHFGVIEFSPDDKYAKVHGFVRYRQGVFAPLNPTQEHEYGWNQNHQNNNGGSAIWVWANTNNVGALKDDGLMNTYNTIYGISNAKEIDYNNPNPDLPPPTDSSFGNQHDYHIDKKDNEPAKKKLYDPSTNFDVREGFINSFWLPEVRDWNNNKINVSLAGAKFFIDMFKKRNPNATSDGFNAELIENRYTHKDANNQLKLGVLTGLETIQYYPDFSKIVISDNGYYHDWDSKAKKLVLKRRMKDNKINPMYFVVYAMNNTELGHNIYSAIDLAKANWDKKQAIRNILDNAKDSTNIKGAKIVSKTFHLINPHLGEGKYVDNNGHDVRNISFKNGIKSGDEERNSIVFESKFGDQRQLLIYDFDYYQKAFEDGEKIFGEDIVDFNNFYKGVLNECIDQQTKQIKYIDLPQNGVTATRIKNFIVNKEFKTENNNKSLISNPSHIRIAKVNNKLIINFRTGNYLPGDTPANLLDKTNLYYQEYNILVENLPLYYRDIDVHVNIPELKNLAESQKTFNENILAQLNEKHRDPNNANKITFGPASNPDLVADNISDLVINNIDYDHQIFEILNVKTNQKVKIKATTNLIPQVKYINASASVNNKINNKDYEKDLNYVNSVIYNQVIKLTNDNANPNKGNPVAYINVPTSKSTDANANNIAYQLFREFDETTGNYPSNLDKNSTSAQIRYDANNHLLYLLDYGTTTKKPAALVIRLMPNTIWSANLIDKNKTTLYKNNEGQDLFINKVLENKGDVLKTINQLINNFDQVNNQKYIGGFSLINPRAIAEKQNNLIQIKSDDLVNSNDSTTKRTRSIGLYDHYSYFLNNVDGAELFEDYVKLLETIKHSKNDDNTITNGFKYDLDKNNDLVMINNSNDFNNNVRNKIINGQLSSVEDDKVKIKYVEVTNADGTKFGRFIVKGFISENDELNKVAIYNIDHIPNIVESNETTLTIPTLSEIIANDGDEFKALKTKWSSYSGNNSIYNASTKEITIGLAKFNLDTAIFSVDEKTRKFLIIRDPKTLKTLAVVILKTPLERVIAKNKLYEPEFVVDNHMNLSDAIAKKIMTTIGSSFDDNYNLAGYIYQNECTVHNSINDYQIKNGSQTIHVLDAYTYERNNDANSQGYFSGLEIFKDTNAFKKWSLTITQQFSNLKNNDLAVSQLKAWLNQQTSINYAFKNTNQTHLQIRKYKDKLLLISKIENQPIHLLTINNLPDEILDKSINLEIPSLNELIENHTNLKDELIKRLLKLNNNTTTFRIENRDYNKDQAQFEFDYENNKIVIKQNDQVDIIKCSKNLVSIKYVDANNTKPQGNQTKTTIAFNDLNNAVYISNLYKEIHKAIDYTSNDKGAKLFSNLPADVQLGDVFNFRKQFDELTVDLLFNNKKIFDANSRALTIKYDANHDQLIIKDNDKTPTALVITNCNRYLDNPTLVIPANIATSPSVNLEIKKVLTDTINNIAVSQNNTKRIGYYDVINPIYNYANANELYARIDYQNNVNEQTNSSKPIYLISINKYHEKALGNNLDLTPKTFYQVKKVGLNKFVNYSSLDGEQQQIVQKIFNEAIKNHGKFDDYKDLKFKYIIEEHENHERENCILFSATKKDQANFKEDRTYFFKVCKLVNVVDDNSASLKTPTVNDIIKANFDYNIAFKSKWIKNSNNEYVIGTAKINENNIQIDLADSKDYVIVKDKTKDNNKQIIGYVILKTPIETVRQVSYHEVPPQELQTILKIAKNFLEVNNIAQSREQLYTLKHLLPTEIANFDKNTISVELRPDGSILLFDAKKPSANYLILKDVPKYLEASSFYNLLDLITLSNEQINPVNIFKTKWSVNKRVGGKQVVDPIENQTKTQPHFYVFNEKDHPQQFIYIYDPHLYFTNTINAKDNHNTLKINEQKYRVSALAVGTRKAPLAQLNNEEINKLLTDANWDISDAKIQIFGSKMLVMAKDKNDQNKIKYGLITNLPEVLDPCGLNIPNENQIIYDSLGDVNDALAKMLADEKRTPRDSNGKILIRDEAVDPNQVELIYNTNNGSIKYNLNHVAKEPINPISSLGYYKVVDANTNRARLSHEHSYELIQKIKHDCQINDEGHKLLGDLKNDLYLQEHLPADLDPINSTIEYDLTRNLIIIRGTNKDINNQINNSRLIIKNVPKVVNPYVIGLYTIDDVINNLGDTKKTLEQKWQAINAVNSEKTLGDYTILEPTQISNSLSNNKQVLKIESTITDGDQFKKAPIYLYDPINYVKPIDATAQNVFINKNDLKNILDHSTSEFKDINSQNQLLNNSINMILDANGLIKNQKIKQVRVNNQLVFVISGYTTNNVQKIIILQNLPYIIYTNLDDENNVIKVINVQDLLNVDNNINNQKQRWQAAFAQGFKKQAIANNFMINGNNFGITENSQIQVQINDTNDPVEINVFVTNNNVQKLIGTMVIPLSALPQFKIVNQPQAWANDPLVANEFYNKLNDQTTNSLTSLMNDEAFKTIVPKDFNLQDQVLSIVNDVNNKGLYFFNSTTLVLVNKTIRTINYHDLYTIEDVAKNENDVLVTIKQKLNEILALSDNKRRIGNLNIPLGIDVDRKDKNFNTLFKDDFGRVYIIDQHTYRRGIDASLVFDNYVWLKELITTLSATDSLLNAQALNNQELIKMLKANQLDPNTTMVKLIDIKNTKALMLVANDTSTASVFVITNLPLVVNEKEFNHAFPSITDIIDNNGNIKEAILNKFKNEQNNITINNQQYNIKDLNTIVNKDGSITLVAPQNVRLTIVSNNPLPSVYSEDANENEYLKIYKVTKTILDNDTTATNKSIAYTKVKELAFIKELINRAFAGVNINLDQAIVKYDKATAKLTIYQPTNDHNFGNLLIVNNIPQVIEARSLYTVNEAIDNIDSTETLITNKLKALSLNNQNQFQNFHIANQFIVNKQNNTNYYVSATKDVNDKMRNLFIVDQYQYVNQKIDGSAVFNQINAFANLQKQLKANETNFNKEQILANGLDQQVLNNDEFNKFAQANELFKNNPQLISVPNQNYWIVYADHNIAVINHLPNVVDENDAFEAGKQLPNEFDVIVNNGGNYKRAIINALKNENQQIIVNKQIFNPQIVNIAVNNDNTISFIDPQTLVSVNVVVKTKIPSYQVYDANIHKGFRNLNEVAKLRALLEKIANNQNNNQTIDWNAISQLGILVDENNPIRNTEIYPSSFGEQASFSFIKDQNRLAIKSADSNNPSYIIVNNIQQTIYANVIYNNIDVIENTNSITKTITNILKNLSNNNQISLGSFNLNEPIDIQTLSDRNYLIRDKNENKVYVIDGRIYDQVPIIGENVFDSLKDLYRIKKILGNEKGNLKRFGQLADVHGLIKSKVLTNILVNAKNFDYDNVTVQVINENLYVLEGYDKLAKAKRVVAFVNIPTVVALNDKNRSPFTKVSDDEVAKTNGDVGAAYYNQLVAKAVGEPKTVQIDQKTYPLDEIGVRYLKDGTIQVYKKGLPGEKDLPIISMVEDQDSNEYIIKDAVDGPFFNHENQDKTNINNLINAINDAQPIDPNNDQEKSLKQVLDHNPDLANYLKQNNFDTNNTEASIKYDPINNQFIINDHHNPSKVVIINSVPKVLEAISIYQPQDVLINSNDVTITLNNKLKALAKQHLEFVLGRKYSVKAPFTVSINKASQNVIQDANATTSEITIIEPNKYANDYLDGTTIFNKIKPYKKLFDLLKVKKTLSFAKNEIKSNELINYLKGLNIDLSDAQLVYVNDHIWMLSLPLNQPNNLPNIYGIATIPYVVNQNESIIHFPTDDEVIANKGSIEEAIKQQIKQLKTNNVGNVIIDGKELNPNYVDVQVEEDGTIKILTFDPLKPNIKKLGVAINQDDDNFKKPHYYQQNGQDINHRDTKLIYDLMNKHNISENKNVVQTKLTFLLANEQIKNKLKDNDQLIDLDFDSSLITYNPLLENISISGFTKDHTNKVLMVITAMKNVIYAHELYNSGLVTSNSPVDELMSQLLNPHNRDANNKNIYLIGAIKYRLRDPYYLPLEQKLDNDSIISDADRKQVYVIDKNVYKVASDDERKQIINSNLLDLEKTIAKLNEKPATFINANNLEDQTLLKNLQDNNINLNKAKIAFVNDCLQVVAVNDDGTTSTYSIPKIKNVVSSNYIHIANDRDVIENNAALVSAIKNALNNEKLNPHVNNQGKIRLGNQIINPKTVIVEIEKDQSNKPTGNVLIKKQDPTNLANRVLVAKLLTNKQNHEVVSTNYQGFNGYDLNQSSLADLLRDLNESLQQKNITKTSVEQFKDSIVFKQIVPKSIDLSKTTIEYNNSSHSKLVIRSNNPLNKRVFVVYNLPEPSSKLEANTNNEIKRYGDDRVRIWAPIVATLLAIIVSISGIIIGLKLRKKRKEK